MSFSRNRLVTLRSGLRERRLGYNIVPIHRFDETTGQVYNETTAPIQSSDDRTWATEDNDGRSCVKHSRRTMSSSTRSLRNIALDSIVENISDITLEVIEGLPISMISEIWNAVTVSGHETFNVWRTFSKLLQASDPLESLMQWDQVIQPPRSPLDIYTKPLSSSSFDFIALLSLSNPFPISDLVKLSNLPNLGALEIIRTVGQVEHEISDRVIRTWGDEAQRGAFTVLRVLKLWNWEQVTNQSLQYVNNFLSLAVYDVRGCNFDLSVKTNARALGWEALVQYPLEIFADPAPTEKITSDQRVPKSSSVSGSIRLSRLKKKKKIPAIQTLYRKIGDFRKNMDLVHAGIRPEGTKQEPDSKHVEQIPVASIRIRLAAQEAFPNGGMPARNLVFIRLDVAVAKKSHPSHDEKRESSKLYPKMQIEAEGENKKRQSGAVVKRKKQRLDDLLSSFN